jgi:hypothetical protein
MAVGRKRSCFGGSFLALSGVLLALLLFSGRWTFALRSPRDRWRVSLGSDFLGGGVLSLDALRDPTAKFMLEFHAMQPRQGAWSLEWRLPPMRANPVTVDPRGLGSREMPGVAWIHDAKTIRSAALIFWPIPPLIALPGLLLWASGRRAARRSRRNQCIGCGYDLSATPAQGPCPECGSARAVPSTLASH